LDVIDEEFEVHGRGNFPTMKVSPARLIRAIQKRVIAAAASATTISENHGADYCCGGAKIRRAKLNGGAASYILLAPPLVPVNKSRSILSSSASQDGRHQATSLSPLLMGVSSDDDDLVVVNVQLNKCAPVTSSMSVESMTHRDDDESVR